jgi:hypothetical protein
MESAAQENRSEGFRAETNGEKGTGEDSSPLAPAWMSAVRFIVMTSTSAIGNDFTAPSAVATIQRSPSRRQLLFGIDTFRGEFLQST